MHSLISGLQAIALNIVFKCYTMLFLDSRSEGEVLSNLNVLLDFQGVAETGNTSVCRTTTELSGLAQTSKVSVKYNLYLYLILTVRAQNMRQETIGLNHGGHP